MIDGEILRRRSSVHDDSGAGAEQSLCSSFALTIRSRRSKVHDRHLAIAPGAEQERSLVIGLIFLMIGLMIRLG